MTSIARVACLGPWSRDVGGLPRDARAENPPTSGLQPLRPEAAVINNGETTLLFVVGPDQTVELRPVQTGQHLPRWVEITAGLEEGERIVVEGHQKIGPGMRVAPAPPEKAAAYQWTPER